MNLRSRRGPVVASATALLLLLSLDSAPSGSSVPATSPPPPEEIRALEEIASWLVGGPKSLEAVRPSDLTSSAPLAFELFRSYTDEESRHDLLRGFPYGEEMLEVAADHQVDGLLLAALVEVESSFAPGVVSPKGAVGLMQVLPTTGQLYGQDDLTDPKANLEVGTRYLSHLIDRFDGQIDLALAAYNAGPGAVSRYDGIPPYRETRAYVDRVLSLYVEHHRRVWDDTGATDLILLR